MKTERGPMPVLNLLYEFRPKNNTTSVKRGNQLPAHHRSVAFFSLLFPSLT